MKKRTYEMSIRCYFPGQNNFTQHYPEMELKDIPKWIEAYSFTHDNLKSVTIKIWVKEKDE